MTGWGKCVMRQSKAGQFWNSFKIAFSMYSKIPMPQSEWTKENMRYVMCFFPLIGVVIGGLSWLWGAYAPKVLDSRVFITIVLLLIPVAISGGIHLDGLLDTSDALNSYQPREKKLEILKDSNAGAFAIIVGICYFLLYFGVYSELTSAGLPVVCLGFVLSRGMGAFSIASFPMAKNTGLAAAFSDGAQKHAVRVVSVLFSLAAASDGPSSAGYRRFCRSGRCAGIPVLLPHVHETVRGDHGGSGWFSYADL